VDKYYVESPGQIVNAFEVIHLRQQPWLMIVRFNGSKDNDSQIKNVLLFYKNCELMNLNSSIKYIFSFIEFVSYFALTLLRFSKGTIYVGCHKSKFIALFHFFRVAMVLLDDGIASLLYANRQKSHRLSLVDKLLNKHQKMDIFTSLDLPELPSHYKVVNHDYGYLRSIKKGVLVSDDVLFFGAKYIEVGILTADQYVALLISVLKYFKGRAICYVPHRQESELRLSKYEELGFSIMRIDLPSELELVSMDKQPKCVAGFFTAALLTSHQLIPDIEVYTFKIPQDSIPENSRENVEYMYEYVSRFSRVIIL
jgi:hypothetical protein